MADLPASFLSKQHRYLCDGFPDRSDPSWRANVSHNAIGCGGPTQYTQMVKYGVSARLCGDFHIGQPAQENRLRQCGVAKLPKINTFIGGVNVGTLGVFGTPDNELSTRVDLLQRV